MGFGAPWCDHKTGGRRTTTQLSELTQVQLSSCCLPFHRTGFNPGERLLHGKQFSAGRLQTELILFGLTEAAQGGACMGAGSWSLICFSAFAMAFPRKS